VPAAVLAPEVLASPPGEGLLLVPVVPLFMVPVSFFIVPCDAPGPTLPWLDAPSLGWAFCAAAGKASARMQAEANTIFFTNDLPGFRLISVREKRCLVAFVPIRDPSRSLLFFA
jgi:hypothetical protein